MKVKKLVSLCIAICILFSMLTFQVSASVGAECLWLEAENAAPDTGVSIGSIGGDIGSTYQTLSGLKALRLNSGTRTGIGINFNFEVGKEQTYDIFVHGTYEENSDYMSTISMLVDQQPQTITNIYNEGWIIKGSSSYNYQVGWQKVTVNLTEGQHVFRWQIDGKGQKATTNKALCDAIVIVPSYAGFTPTKLESADSLFSTKNKADYQLCTLLNEYDLTKIEENLTLPTETIDRTQISWSTSDTNVITANGTIKKSSVEKTATLTAKILVGGEEYTKAFIVTVAAEEIIPVISDYAWIEAEDASPDSGGGFGSISGESGSTFQSLSGLKALRVNSGTKTGIGINFNFEVGKEQSYDIFVHGTYEVNSSYMSTISMIVDNVPQTVANLKSEGWIIKGSSGYNFQVGWQKITVKLTSGEHLFRWQIDGKGSNASTNKALCDAIVIVPTSVGFTPTPLETVDSLFSVKNKADYQLCTLLADVNLSSVTEDIELPLSTCEGIDVKWESSDVNVIDNNGKINPETSAQRVSMTATITVDGQEFSKEFDMYVSGKKENSNEYIWLEETDATFNNFNRHFALDAFSGGFAYGCNTETAPDENGYYLEYEFEVNKPDDFTIWLNATQSEHSQASDVKIYIDGVLYNDEKHGPDMWSGTTFVYSWRKVIASLGAGKHTIKYLVDGKENKTNKYYRAMLDCICIVPSEYMWSEPSVNSRPYKTYYFEAENYNNTNWKGSGSIVVNDSSMRGDKYISLYSKPSSDVEYYVDYTVVIPQSGYYRLNVASTPPQDSGWSSKIYASINSSEIYEISAEKTSTSESSLSMYLSDAVYFTEGLNNIKFIVKDRVDSGFYVCQIDYFSLSLTEVDIVGIYSDKPYMIFENDKDIELYVQANGFVPENTEIEYVVSDYYDNVIETGIAVIYKGERKGAVNLGGLANGYYKISATYNGKTAVNDISVVVPLSMRKTYNETPFAIDVNFYALYNKYAENKEMLRQYVEALKLLGVTWIRDRIPFDDSLVKNENGVISVNASKNINIGKIVKENSDIKISTVINAMPSWTEYGYSEKLDTNFTEVYNLFKALGDTIGDNTDAIEILNESDKGGGVGDDDGADVYAAFLKAAAVGIADSNSNAMVINQGNARYPNYQGKFPELLYENDIFKYVSADNYHSHVLIDESYLSDYTAFPGVEGNKIVDYLKNKYSVKTPVWITEAGYLIENPAEEELDTEERNAQAKYLVTSTTESLASGVDKHFFFLGIPFQDTNATTGISYTTGIMNKDARFPAFYPSYSAMSAMTYILGEGQYIGKIEDDNVCAYAFKDGDKTVLVLYTTEGNKTYSVNLNCDNATLYDMFANTSDVKVQNKIASVELSSEPVYLKFTGDISEYLNKENADSLIAPEKISLTDADRIVLLQKYSDTSKEDCRRNGYYIDNSNNTITVTVTNLNNTAKTVTVKGSTDSRWTISQPEQTVVVEPFSTADLTFKVNRDEYSYYSKIYFKGTVDGVETSASCVYAYGGFAGVDFVDADGNHLYNITDGKDSYVKLNVYNKKSLSSPVIKVYVAAYKGDNFINLDITDVKVQILSNKEELIKIKPSSEADTYKVFLWNSSMKPYANSAILTNFIK